MPLPFNMIWLFALFPLFLIGRIIYNIFLHPLRKYPGPLRCSASRLPITKHLVLGSQVWWIRQLHEQYGPVVRVAPDQLSFTDERAWFDIGGSTKYAKFGMAKDERLNDLVGGDTINPDITKSKAEQKHTQMRKAFAPGLTKAALKKQDDLIRGYADEFIRELSLRGFAGQQAIDLTEMSSFLAYNIFSDLFLGDSFNLFQDYTYVPWVRSIKAFARSTMIMGSLQHYFMARHVLAFVIRKFGGKYRDAFMNVCFDRFDRRAAREHTGRPDLFHFATAEKTSGNIQQLPLKEMRDFSPFLMLAGGETTPTLLIGLIYCLLRHPEKKARLLQEIHDSIPTLDDIRPETLLQMEYLGVCIEETLRIYPPIAAGVERVTPKGGAPIGDHFVPGGMIVLVPQFASHRHSRNFANPDSWVPERWLTPKEETGGESIYTKDRRNASKPFSVGPHACFGQDLAQYVVRLAVVRMLTTYDLELHPDSELFLDDQECYFGWVKPELKIYFTPKREEKKGLESL